jgi:transcriptional regulator with XRE-family HTH domain
MSFSQHSNRYKKFCDLLIASRRHEGLTQAEVAKRLGKPQSYVSKYETGERRLDVIEFLDVADAVGANAQAIVKKLA